MPHLRLIAEKSQTYGQFLEEWLDTYIEPMKSPTTTPRYVEQIEKYITPVLDKKKI